MPNPQNVPKIANGVLALVVLATAVLLFGAPVEHVLSVTDNPVSRVAVVTFTLALVGTTGLAFALHLLLARHKRMEAELEEMRRLVESSNARFTALSQTADGLEARVGAVLEDIQEEMALERERMRAQARAYLAQAPGGTSGNGKPTKEARP